MKKMVASIRGVRTPQLGEVWVAFSQSGLVAVEYGVRRDVFAASVRRRASVSTEPASAATVARLRQATCELVEYLDGRRREFTLPIDWSALGSDFQRAALKAVAAIPYGETRTYAEIAAEIGHPLAQRAVGRANATNPMPLVIPCHRVIGSDGKLHGYGGRGGLKTKQWLLDLEKGAELQRPSQVVYW
jgi:methylated-DNA-[protein]-cysteine S-methyltransferase